MTTKAQKQTEREEAIAVLRAVLKPGDTVYTQLKHVSRSGMLRTIQAVRIRSCDERGNVAAFWFGWHAAKVLAYPFDERREGVKVNGCGMDMGFYLVYSLAYALWPEGFDCTGDGCGDASHSNDRDAPRGAGVHHGCSGYALTQPWL